MKNIESMKEFLRKNIHCFTGKARENKPHLVAGTLIILSLFIFLCIFSQGGSTRKLATLQNKRSELMLHELSDISSKLQQISKNPSESKTYESALKGIQKDIADVQKSITEIAKISDIQKVSNQITSIKDDVDNGIDDLKKAVSLNLGNKQLLDSDALPFHVISIDVISGQPYVSVDYENHVSPIAIGDLLAGWRVSNADYDSSIAEFVNEKNQLVRINVSAKSTAPSYLANKLLSMLNGSNASISSSDLQRGICCNT